MDDKTRYFLRRFEHLSDARRIWHKMGKREALPFRVNSDGPKNKPVDYNEFDEEPVTISP